MYSFDMKEGNVTVLGQKTQFVGDLEFSDNLVITGTFDGKITSKGNLKIDKTAQCKVSSISADSIFVAGVVNGDMKATSKVEIATGSTVIGDIEALRLRIDDNVDFHGQITMLDESPDVDIFSLTASEYKRACTKFRE